MFTLSVLTHLDVAAAISLTYPFTRLAGDAKARVVCKIDEPRTMGFKLGPVQPVVDSLV